MNSATVLSELGFAAPLIVLFGGALLVLLLEVFLKVEWPRGMIALATLICAFTTLLSSSAAGFPERPIFSGLLYADPFAAFITAIVLIGAVMSVMIGMDHLERCGVESPGEYYALLLMSLVGALVFAASAELITLFVGLEIMSLAIYPLCGAAVTNRHSAESALKYFLLGSFSSAFLLYGIALIYGMTGTTSIPEIAEMLPRISGTMLYFSIGLILVGFFFKVAAVPFHFWAPDVYQGAPTPVTAFMATVIKAAAVAAALRVLWVALADKVALWSGTLWVVVVLTMTLGNLVALRQRSLKRMLAYSSIAHAGYILMGLLAPTDEFGGGAAILFYLLAYSIMTIGAFGIVQAIMAGRDVELRADEITRFNGLAQRNPGLAALMAIFMLTLAGIPPGMAGFLGKFYIFGAAVKAGYVGLAIIGVINSAISAYYYLRVIVAMYFVEGDESTAVESPAIGAPLMVALLACAAGCVLLGLFPSAIHDGAQSVITALR